MTSAAELVLTALTDGDELARRFSHGDTTEPVLLTLLRHRSTDVRHAVATCPDASARVLTNAALDSSPRVRAAVAERHDTPTEVLVALADDIDRSILVAIAGNPSTPTPVIDRLSERAIEEVRRAAAVTTSSPERIEALANDRSPAVRALIATRPGLPTTIGRRLADDPDETVRIRLAEHSDDTTVLVHLAADVASVAGTVARRTDLTGGVTAVLLTAGWTVRRILAGNEHVDGSALSRLSTDRSAQVRRTAIGNPTLPDRSLRRALSHRDIATRRLARSELERRGARRTACTSMPQSGDDLGAVLEWVETTDRFDDLASFVTRSEWPRFARRTALLRVPLPTTVFEAASTADDVVIRLDAAGHRLCPRQVLERLATDTDDEVRRRAAARLSD